MSTKSWSFVGQTTVVFAGNAVTHVNLLAAVRAQRRRIGWALSAIDADLIAHLGYLPVSETLWSFRRYLCSGEPSLYEPVKIHFFDELGFRIPAWKIREVYLSLAPAKSCGQDSKAHVFRQGPVPGTSSKGGGMAHYYRRVQTQQELQRYEAESRDEELLE